MRNPFARFFGPTPTELVILAELRQLRAAFDEVTLVGPATELEISNDPGEQHRANVARAQANYEARSKGATNG